MLFPGTQSIPIPNTHCPFFALSFPDTPNHHHSFSGEYLTWLLCPGLQLSCCQVISIIFCFLSINVVVPNLLGTRDRFHGIQIFHGSGVEGEEDGSGGNASDGERQMKLQSLAQCSPPAVRSGSLQASAQYPSAAQRLGTPELMDHSN